MFYFDEKKFDRIMKDTDELLGQIDRDNEFYSWVNDYAFHESHSWKSGRVLRRLVKPILYVGAGAALFTMTFGAAAQTPPENQINDLPTVVHMKPGDFRVMNIDDNYYTFVFKHDEKFMGADITFRAEKNLSLDLPLGGSVSYGVKTSKNYQDYDPDMIIVNMGNQSGEQNFLFAESYSGKLVDVYKGVYTLSRLPKENITEEDRQNYISILSQLKEDLEDVKFVFQTTNSLVSTAANIAVDKNQTQYAYNFIQSTETVFGKEYLFYKELGLNETPMIDSLRTVHDVGIGSVRDDIGVDHEKNLDYAHVKSQLYTEMNSVVSKRLENAIFRVDDLNLTVQSSDTTDVSRMVDSLIKELYPDPTLINSEMTEALVKFQGRASSVGAMPYQTEPKTQAQIGNPVIPIQQYVILGAGVLTGAGLTALLMRKFRNDKGKK